MVSQPTGHDPASKPGAVFLSYAKEDTVAARQIADALRGFGVEVWFDQNELRGGDAWDAMIRTQVRTCTLFMPVISAVTQARGEGYFRREWKLAVERTHDMAEHIPFILPVAIDDTQEATAFVPDQFRRVQWTRLPGGRADPAVRGAGEAPPRRPGVGRGRRRFAAAPRRPGVPGAPGARSRLAAMAAVAVVAIGAALYFRASHRPQGGPRGGPAGRPPVQAAPAPPKVDAKSIAVLPFENMSEDKENNAFFADGIHEDILTNLALIPEMRVVSRTSVMQYRATVKPIRQIGQELAVAYILEGSVRRSGNKVRVTGQLIRTATDEHIWAKAYDRDLTDVFAIQAELAQEIAAALQAALSPETKKLLERKPTENLAAYDLWLKARQIENGNDRAAAALRKRLELLQGAVDLDPGFAQAWSDLAVTHALFCFWNFDHTDARLAQAKAAIDTAVRLAPDLPDVIQDQGSYYYYGYRDFTRALERYERLAQLRPNDATVYSSLGLIQRRQGDWVASLANLRKATQLDPANGGYSENLVASLLRVRRFEEARAEKQRQLSLDPENMETAYEAFSMGYLASGSTAETDAFLAGLSAAKANSPRGINLRRDWARTKGDFAEAVRLDAIQPYFDEDGTPHYEQAAALVGDYISLNGDRAAARERIAPIVAELRSRLDLEPENALYLDYLAGLEAMQGDREKALMHATKAVQLVPESKDHLDGPFHSVVLAMVYAWVGDKDQAFREIDRLMRVPTGSFLNVDDMRYNPWLIPLHGDPRFEALLNDPANKVPLF